MRVLLWVQGLMLIGMTCLGAEPVSKVKEYDRTNRFESAIVAFETMDKKEPPPTGAVVCVGSSTMRKWHSTIAKDLAPLTVIPRGFGGSSMSDALHYVDRIVIAYKPRAVVLYEGDNDIAAGVAPEKVCDAFRGFVARVHQQLPETRIYVLSIKPSVSRWKLWSKMQAANDLIAKKCAEDKLLTYVDVASAMLDANLEPRKDIFEKDNLHMNRAGYELWRDVLRPVLMKAELPHEPQVQVTPPTH